MLLKFAVYEEYMLKNRLTAHLDLVIGYFEVLEHFLLCCSSEGLKFCKILIWSRGIVQAPINL